MLRLYIFLSITICFISCNKTIIDAELSDILGDQTVAPKLLFISGLHGKSHKLYKEFEMYGNKHKEYELYYCDCGLNNNRDILYCCGIAKTPTIVLISENNKISSIYNQDCSIEDWLSDFSRISADYSHINTRLLIWHAIHNKDISTLEEIDERLLKDSFYDYYILYLLNSLLDKNVSASKYKELAISSFQQKPELLYTILYKKLIQNVTYEYSLLVFEKLSLNFKASEYPKEKCKTIKFANYGKQPGIIFDAYLTCNCLNLEFNTVTRPNEVGELRITLNELKSSDIGSTRQILLFTNSTDQNIIIDINIIP